jgi:Sap, sulfolipid-1-addressing protein
VATQQRGTDRQEPSTRLNVDLPLLLFALVAGLSPMAFAVTLAVINAGRSKALAFTVAIVASQFLVGAILVLLGGWTVPNRQGHPTVRALLELAFAGGMLWLTVRVWRQPANPTPRSSSRTDAALKRLEQVHVGTALAAGLLLGIGGPKRLLLTALAAGTIATADSHQKAAQLCAYSIVATFLVWAPVLTFEIFGDRALDVIVTAGRWLALRQRKVLLIALPVLALAALAGALSILV